MLEDVNSITAYIVTYREIGDRVASLEPLADEAYSKLNPYARGIVVLATCNRFEVYADTVKDENLFKEILGEVLGDAARHLRVLRGLDAVKHLFTVAAGLDSKIPGDHEVLGQVRKAWITAREKGFISRMLDLLFHYAVVAGKRVREETAIGRGRFGYPSAAVELAMAKGVGGSSKILVIGTGLAAKSIISNICRKLTPSAIIVAGRRPDKARDIVVEECVLADIIVLDSLQGLRNVDAAFIAVSGKHPALEIVPKIAKIVVDISMPPTVSGSNVFNYRDVEEYAKQKLTLMASEIEKAMNIVEEEVEKFARRLAYRRADRAISAIMAYAERLVEEEASEAARVLDLGEDGKRVLETAMYSLVKRLLHPLFQTLRVSSLNGSTHIVDSLAKAYESKLYSRRG